MSKKHPEFAERLVFAMKSVGTTRTQLSEKTSINYEMIRRYEEGLAKPREEKLRKIANALGVNFAYLSYGEGEVKPKPSFDELKSMVKGLENKDSNSPSETSRIEINGYIPVISWVAAGAFVEVVDPATMEDVEEWIPRPPNAPKNSFGLRVRGRSMYPEFKPGEIIYINPNISPIDLNDGDLIVIQYVEGGEATFKQLIVGETSDDMYLKPLNSEWHEQTITPLEECKLVGKVYAKYVTY